MKETRLVFRNEGRIVGALREVPNPRALIVLVHGFTGTMDGPDGIYRNALSSALGGKGFDVFRFNFRFTDKTWKHFDRMTVAGEISDLKLIMREFSGGYAKIGVIGESMGGGVSVAAAGRKAKCMVLWYPVLDMTEVFPARIRSESLLMEFTEKNIRVGKRFAAESRSIRFYGRLKSITCPTMVISPTKDTSVPFGQSAKCVALLGSRNKALYPVKDAEHGWWRPDWNGHNRKAEKFAITKTVEWLDRWLK